MHLRQTPTILLASLLACAPAKEIVKSKPPVTDPCSDGNSDPLTVLQFVECLNALGDNPPPCLLLRQRLAQLLQRVGSIPLAPDRSDALLHQIPDPNLDRREFRFSLMPIDILDMRTLLVRIGMLREGPGVVPDERVITREFECSNP